jgi:hypothetical protein
VEFLWDFLLGAAALSSGCLRLWIKNTASEPVTEPISIPGREAVALLPRSRATGQIRLRSVMPHGATAKWWATAMGIFSEIFSWWGGNTWGTRLTIWRQGRFIGRDDFGNRYYEQKKGVGPLGRPRRWVTYTDFAEASKVPADWHGWLHHVVEPPTA